MTDQTILRPRKRRFPHSLTINTIRMEANLIARFVTCIQVRPGAQKTRKDGGS
jgi:hypothetical protein